MRISERDIKAIRVSTEQSRADQSRFHAGAIRAIGVAIDGVGWFINRAVTSALQGRRAV